VGTSGRFRRSARIDQVSWRGLVGGLFGLEATADRNGVRRLFDNFAHALEPFARTGNPAMAALGTGMRIGVRCLWEAQIELSFMI
jgi:hypothetical protein